MTKKELQRQKKSCMNALTMTPELNHKDSYQEQRQE